jgi:hypothetical protein
MPVARCSSGLILIVRPHCSMIISRFTFCFLLVACNCVVGCTSLVHHSDPLAGWHHSFSQDPSKLDEVIVDDYQDYIHQLPARERKYVGDIFFFEDGTGQHAVRISIPLDGTEWAHILIYDKNGKRIKVTKYRAGRYRS